MKFLRYLLLLFSVVVLFSFLFYRNIGVLLSKADVPVRSDVIICMSGSSERVDKTAQLLQQGLAQGVVATTDMSYQEMLRKKIQPDKILKAGWSADSTYEEGLLLAGLLRGRKFKSALVVSDPFHLYRVRWTLRHHFPDDTLHFSFISSDAPSLQGFWWSNERSRLFVLSELPKIVYYWLWHGLLGIAEDPEWAVDLERVYMGLVLEVVGEKG